MKDSTSEEDKTTAVGKRAPRHTEAGEWAMKLLGGLVEIATEQSNNKNELFTKMNNKRKNYEVDIKKKISLLQGRGNRTNKTNSW